MEYRSTAPTGKKPKKVRYHFSIVFFAAVIIFGVMFYRYMKDTTLEDVLTQDGEIVVSGASDAEKDEESGQEEQSQNSDNVEDDGAEDGVNPIAESEAVSDEYLQSCVFIGDSIVYGMSSYGIVPASNVYASMSMNVTKAETEPVETQYGDITILEALEADIPENIYILLGSKGAAWLTPSEMYSSYSSFVTKVIELCPDSDIYIIAVPPVTAAKETSVESPVSNSDIDDLNERMLELCNNKGIYFLDLNSYLKDDTGCMPAADAENDGVHFKYSTYEKMVDYILTHTVDGAKS